MFNCYLVIIFTSYLQYNQNCPNHAVSGSYVAGDNIWFLSHFAIGTRYMYTGMLALVHHNDDVVYPLILCKGYMMPIFIIYIILLYTFN